jgi:hypothetical protein
MGWISYLGWVLLAFIGGVLLWRWWRRLVRCNLCKGRFTPHFNLIDPWDREWVHCPYCRVHGRPPDAPPGADGCRLTRSESK